MQSKKNDGAKREEEYKQKSELSFWRISVRHLFPHCYTHCACPSGVWHKNDLRVSVYDKAFE